jgi:hypothetical protein
LRTPVRWRRTTVQEVVEFLLLIGTKHGADCGEQVALFLLEAVPCFPVDLFEAVSALFEQLLDLIALRGVELNLAGQPIEQLGWECRSTRAATEQWAPARTWSWPRSAAPEPVGTHSGTLRRPHASDAHRREQAPGDKARRPTKKEDGQDEQPEPHPRAVIGHGALR